MKADPKVIEHLNTQLTNELTAVNQYFLHARTLRHWGVTRLGKKEYDESIEEMHHADWLIERVLFLDGLPNVQRLNKIMVGETVEEILRSDLAIEQKAMVDLREGIAHCESVRDFVSRDLLRRIRRISKIPILMLTARGDDTDRIAGLNLGADDYVPKPCSPGELAARLKAILRRTSRIVAHALPEVIEAMREGLASDAAALGADAGREIKSRAGPHFFTGF